jgi:hypothetical protein
MRLFNGGEGTAAIPALLSSLALGLEFMLLNITIVFPRASSPWLSDSVSFAARWLWRCLL